jgi:hypothetical protein
LKASGIFLTLFRFGYQNNHLPVEAYGLWLCEDFGACFFQGLKNQGIKNGLVFFGIVGKQGLSHINTHFGSFLGLAPRFDHFSKSAWENRGTIGI